MLVVGGGHSRKAGGARHQFSHLGLCLLVCLLTLCVLQPVADTLFMDIGDIGADYLVLP